VLVLVRHGETEGNAARQLLGRAESPLTVRGRADAVALGAALGPVSRLVSSPLGRARLTAEALGLDLPVEVDDRWIEVDYGELEGQALGAVPPELWSRWRADPGFAPSGGESLAQVGARVRDACAELFATAGQGARAEADVVVVSHVSPIKAAVAWALGAGDAMVWRPAPSAGVVPAEVAEPVGHVDLVPTFCEIAGAAVPDWAQGRALPMAPGSDRQWAITEWDSQFPHIGMHLRSIFRDGWLCTAYEPGPLYEGTEGELYALGEDPLQWRNLWDDPAYRARRDELVTDLYDNLPPERATKLAVEAPV